MYQTAYSHLRLLSRTTTTSKSRSIRVHCYYNCHVKASDCMDDRRSSETIGDHRKRSAIIGNDRRTSETIGDHRKRSAIIGNDRRTSETAGDHRKRSAIIGNDRRSSEMIGEHRKRSATIGNDRRSSETIGERRKRSAIIGNDRRTAVIGNDRRSSETIGGHRKRPVIIGNDRRPSPRTLKQRPYAADTARTDSHRTATSLPTGTPPSAAPACTRRTRSCCAPSTPTRGRATSTSSR